MILRRLSWILGTSLAVMAFAVLGCGGKDSSSTPPPVEGVKPAPDAPFGGLGNPYNEADKKAASKKKS
jgi:hypothetical protein